MIKRILSITTWILTALGMMALLGFARYTHFNMPVKGLELSIEAPVDGGFLSQVEMQGRISKMVGVNERKSLKSINISRLKLDINTNPYVQKVDAFTSINGFLIVKLYEREPFIRFFTRDNQSFYLDHNGVVFPVHPKHTKRVLVANGYIDPIIMPVSKTLHVNDSSIRTSHIKSIYEIASVIEEHALLKLLIDQIYINSLNEIELTPRIGDAFILLGDNLNLREKLENISIFYQAKATTSELPKYSRINAKFMNQIVCTKRDTL
jgi:cell division protein FtsQ